MKKNCIAWLLTLGLSVAAFAAGPVSRYEVVDLPFATAKEQAEPFKVDFGATWKGPAGEELKVPGFYNGGSEWLMRFSSGTAGTWTYTTWSTVPELNNKTGQLEISDETESRHGPIVVSAENSSLFSYEDGTPYFLSAFECDWLYVLDYRNREATPKMEHFLDLLAANGINQIVTTLYSYDTRWPVDPRLKENPQHDYAKRDYIYPFKGSNPSPDFSELNVDFFKHYDRMVRLMDERDIAAHLMIYVWNKKVNWPEERSEQDDMFYDYVIARYQAFPNVIWDVAKEAVRKPEDYVVDRLDRLRESNVFDRLVTVHDFKFCEKHADKLDFISTQDWSHHIYGEMLPLYQKYDKPVFNIEHGGYTHAPYTVFPGNYTDPEYCLRRNYMCYFAGVYANYYWQGAAWNVLIYNPFEQPDDFAKPKFAYYKHLMEFFTRFDYTRFSPTPEGKYVLKSADEEYLIYLPREYYQRSIYSRKGEGEPKGTLQWFNVLTGEYSDVVAYEGGPIQSPWSGVADSIAIMNKNGEAP